MKLDKSMLYIFNRVSTGFRALRAGYLDWIHIRPQVAEYLQLNESSDVTRSVQAVMDAAGEISRLSLRQETLFGRLKDWRTAWVTFCYHELGRYHVKDSFWKDGSASPEASPSSPDVF